MYLYIMKKLLIFITFIVITCGSSAQEQVKGKVVGPVEYVEEIQGKEIVLIDVRTPEEFQKGHIKGARNIDYQAEDFLSRMSELDKEQDLYIYCRSGNRSQQAAKELEALGFEQIIDLKGGYLAWKSFLKRENKQNFNRK